MGMCTITRRNGEFVRIGDQIVIRVRSGDVRLHIEADRSLNIRRVNPGHDDYLLCQLGIRHVDRKSFKLLDDGQDVLLIGSAVRIPISLKCRWARIDVLAPDMTQVVLVRSRSTRSATEMECDRIARRFADSQPLSGSGAA